MMHHAYVHRTSEQRDFRQEGAQRRRQSRATSSVLPQLSSKLSHLWNRAEEGG